MYFILVLFSIVKIKQYSIFHKKSWNNALNEGPVKLNLDPQIFVTYELSGTVGYPHEMNEYLRRGDTTMNSGVNIGDQLVEVQPKNEIYE